MIRELFSAALFAHVTLSPSILLAQDEPAPTPATPAADPPKGDAPPAGDPKDTAGDPEGAPKKKADSKKDAGAPASDAASSSPATSGGAATCGCGGPTRCYESRPLRSSLKLCVGPVSFVPILLVQVQVLPYVGDDAYAAQGDAADSEGFRLRRGRFGLGVDLLDQGRARVSVELGSREDGEARIHDAWLAYVGLPFLQVFGGAMTVPFSRSAIAGSGDQALTERPLAVRTLAPNQQVGAVAHGEIAKRAFVYDAGVFNGFSRADQFFAGYHQNYAPLGNRFEGLAYVARVASEPLGALSGPIADETHQAPRFGVGGDVFYSDGSARGVLGVSGDALLHAAGFHLLAEGIYSQVSPKSNPEETSAGVADVKSLGVVGEAGYMILKDLLGITARFEYVDSAMGVDDEGDQWLINAGATAMFLDGMVRSTVEFSHREEINGLSLANDAALLQAQLALP